MQVLLILSSSLFRLYTLTKFNRVHIAIGLQLTFKSFLWLTTIPPIIFTIAYKIYINRVYNTRFKYFNPSDEEIRNSQVHSSTADNRGHRLSKRFGHPALHTDLFTPMLHSKMMPLLSEVYKGRIDHKQAALNEYGGQKIEAHLVPGGIKIAAIEQVSVYSLWLHVTPDPRFPFSVI
jgi:hypothetical protein